MYSTQKSRKNSKLKVKIQISGTIEETRNFGKLPVTTIIVKRGAERRIFFVIFKEKTKRLKEKT